MTSIKKTQPKISCKLCNESFSQKSSMTRHCRTFHSQSYSCSNCKLSFGNDEDLKRHMKCQHKKQRVTCSICNKSFSQVATRTRHIKIVHDKTKPYSCKLCENSFSTKDNLKMHVIRNHPLNVNSFKIYSCLYCDIQFSDYQTLRQHKLSHIKSKMFQCNFCGKAYGIKQNLSVHLEKVHKKADSCNICGKVFYSKKHLKAHKKNNSVKCDSSSLEEGEYYCNLCQITFKCRNNFDLHSLRMHKYVVTTHTCDLCKKSCANVDILKKHTLTHFQGKVQVKVFNVFGINQTYLDYNDKEFKLDYCEFCLQTFTNNDILMKHKQSHVQKTALKKVKKPNTTLPIPNNRFSCKLCGEEFGLKIVFLKHKMKHLQTIRNLEDEPYFTVTDAREEMNGCINSITKIYNISSETKRETIDNNNTKRNVVADIDTNRQRDAEIDSYIPRDDNDMQVELINCDKEMLIDDAASMVDEGVHDLDDSRSLD